MALPGEPMAAGAAPLQGVAPTPEPQKPAERVVSDQDDKLAKDLLKRIEAAKARPAVVAALKTFERNRKLLRGIDPETGKKMRANLHFANLAALRPQVYAKDPEYSVKPTAGVAEDKLKMTKALAATCEAVLTKELVKGCKLKKRAKRLLTATFTTSVGWWKIGFQEDKKTDPLISSQIKDTQDDLMRLTELRRQIDEPKMGADADLQLSKLKQMMEGLASKSEIAVGRGLLLDFVLSEDMLILDASVRELDDYPRSSAMAQRVWMTRGAWRARWGFEPKGAKVFADTTGGTSAATPNIARSPEDDLFEVFEVWDQDSSRVFHVATSEKGFLQAPISPDWTGERWLPFFALLFNETDGDMFPLSDIELTEPLVREYNEARDDLVRDRKDALPFTVIRKGGSLTPKDAENIRNRQGNDVFFVEGVGNQPLGNDIQSVTLGKIDPQNYNTQPARADIEQIIGGGDAARGSVMEAKTATEAEILSQGLRGRSAERQDIMEDLLTEVGIYALQVCLRKLSKAEVQAIVGASAEWPEVTSIDQIFSQITLDVRGGSTGKPDRLQDQDRWTKLLPVIEKTIEQVSELREKGQPQLAQALIELTRETLRRFDERLDIETFLPAAKDDEAPDPASMAQQIQQMKAKLEEQQQALDEAQDKQQQMVFTAATAIATSANPQVSAAAFQEVLQVIQQDAAMADQIQQGGAGQPQPGAMPGQPPGAPAGPGGAPAPDLQAAIAAAAGQQQPIPPTDPTQSGPPQQPQA